MRKNTAGARVAEQPDGRLNGVISNCMTAARAAADALYDPDRLQVGRTVEITAQGTYIAVGTSGLVQRLTGIKDAGTVVPINKDTDAAILEIADIGLMSDLFKVLPELHEAIRE